MENENVFGSGTLIILFLIIALMGGGSLFGGGAAAANQGTSELQNAMNLNSILQGQAATQADIQRGIYEINANTSHTAYDNLGEIRDVQAANAAGFAGVQSALAAGFSNMQTGFCGTQRGLDAVNYNVQAQSAAIQQAGAANTQKILDAISGNRIADLEGRVNQLQLQNAMCGVVRYPNASTYCAGTNPFCGFGT